MCVSHLFYTEEVVICFLVEGDSDVLCGSIARKKHDNEFNRFIRLCKVKKGGDSSQ
jgi:hypothetical protein